MLLYRRHSPEHSTDSTMRLLPVAPVPVPFGFVRDLIGGDLERVISWSLSHPHLIHARRICGVFWLVLMNSGMHRPIEGCQANPFIPSIQLVRQSIQSNPVRAWRPRLDGRV